MGFTSAFRVAGLFAIAGFVAALIAVRHRKAVPVEPRIEADIAA